MMDAFQNLMIAILLFLHMVHFQRETKVWKHIRDLWRKG